MLIMWIKEHWFCITIGSMPIQEINQRFPLLFTTFKEVFCPVKLKSSKPNFSLRKPAEAVAVGNCNSLKKINNCLAQSSTKQRILKVNSVASKRTKRNSLQ